MYQPLPHELEIKVSKIHGSGLFAKEDIDDNTKIGLGWLVVGAELIRTPLGGFINHSDNPNCVILPDPKVPHTSSKLITVRPIRKGEELTVYYTMYKL